MSCVLGARGGNPPGICLLSSDNQDAIEWCECRESESHRGQHIAGLLNTGGRPVTCQTATTGFSLYDNVLYAMDLKPTLDNGMVQINYAHFIIWINIQIQVAPESDNQTTKCNVLFSIVWHFIGNSMSKISQMIQTPSIRHKPFIEVIIWMYTSYSLQPVAHWDRCYPDTFRNHSELAGL